VKFSLSWLKTWLETEASLEQITTTLNAIGLEVELVENRAAALAPFIIAEVLEATQHPNADRLRACQVSIGGGAKISVVCGAPNARTGMKAVFAPPGAYIPGSDITLKVGEIRGVKSEGMLVSFRELALGEDHDGIIELPEDAPVGTPYAVWAGMDDPVIDISVTPNRGDALAVRGVARDLAAAGLGTLRHFTPPAIKSEGESAIIWKNEFPEACPYVIGRTVRHVTNGESPDWLKARLTSIGLRPINALVDITNFFTIDLGRPLHVFDADKIAGATLTLRHGSGEIFTGLNGKEITVHGDDCVIADGAGIQSLAGIIGGEATGCGSETKNVFIECALFDRVHIAQAGQRHAIFSDARSRFERGIDSMALPGFLDAATRMVIELCGGTPSQITEAGDKPVWHRRAKLRFPELKFFGGADITPDEAVASLEKLGMTMYRRDGAHIELDIPSWRNDIAAPQALDQHEAQRGAPNAAAAAKGAAEIEPERDLIEEVLRLRGLDAIAPVSLPVSAIIPAPAMTAKQFRTTLARRVLASRGLMECVTFSFLDHNIAALFGTVDDLRLANPIAADLDQMRPTPLATLALAAARNVARGFGDVSLFEVGPAYLSATEQILIAAGIRSGSTPLSAMSPARKFDAMDAKADALGVLAALGQPLDALTATPDAPEYYHPGQSGVLRQGPKTILAQFGTLHPRLCAAMDLPVGSVAFEVFLGAIAEPKRRKKAAPALPPFQPIRRDFAFLVPRGTASEILLRAAKGAERNFINSVTLFDRYEGKNLPEGQISLAIAVTIQPQDKTLTETELDAISAKIIAAVAKATGGTLRG
jgi:phenylalanyl-tRNA synthetase beta chain